MSTSIETSTSDMQRDMRRVLIDAALTVLQTRGAAALTVRNITELAGCSTTGVYTHFGGKQGIVEAMFVEGFDSFDAALADAYAAGELLEAGRMYRRWALANPTHYLVMFGRAVPDFEPSEAAMTRAAASFAGLVTAVEQAGAHDPMAAAYHLYATVHGYVMLELMHMGPIDDRSMEELYEAGLRACAPPAEEPSR
jgi:AcrR family transcriptional regulator